MEQILVVYSNFPQAYDCSALATTLLERRLAACANILPAVQSHFRWQGKIVSDMETTLILKTTVGRFAALQAAILAAHPYDMPEIIALPVAAGLPAYLGWVRSESSEDIDV